MERLYRAVMEIASGVRTWLGTHRSLGGGVLAPLSIIVFMAIGFFFLIRTICTI